MSNALDLLTPYLEHGLRSAHFFNGRLLASGDLLEERQAQRELDRRLGRALGAGIVEGLRVRPATSAAPLARIFVEPGLALTPDGHTLQLPDEVEVALVRAATPASAVGVAAFQDCLPPQSTQVLGDTGLYLLTLQPAAATEGRAPTSSSVGEPARCNARHVVEGVRFRLVELPASLAAGNALTRRNRAAHACFGSGDPRLAALTADPLNPRSPVYGALDDLRPDALADCEVPLAVIDWTSAGIGFVDNWAARRRVHRPAVTGGVAALLSERRQAEAEARLLQFADHAEELYAREAHPELLVAETRFEFLPPAGVLPLAAGVQRGFNPAVLFQNHATRGPLYLEGGQLESLLRASLEYPALRLNERRLIWLYLVRENVVAAGTPAPRVVLAFATGLMPPHATARHDLSLSDFSHYAIL